MTENGPMSALPDQIAAVARRYSGPLSVAALDVASGKRVGWGAEKVVPTASVIKVAILCQAYERLWEMGGDASMPVRIAEKHRVGGSGVLKLAQSVDSMAFLDVAQLMIAVSDNTATNALMDWAGGPDAVTDRMRNYGLKNTVVHDYVTPEVARRGVRSFGESTAGELCMLGERLAGLREDGGPWRAKALDVLALQQDRDLATRYWGLDTAADLFARSSPTVLSVCSKTGFFPRMRSELGVVFVGSSPRMVYALVADESRDSTMGPEAEPAVALGLVGFHLAGEWLAGVEGVRLQRSPYLGAGISLGSDVAP